MKKSPFEAAPGAAPERVPFGAIDVAAAEKAGRVRAVFDSVAARYDLMNDLMSGGLHRLWKAAAVDWLRPRPGDRTIDVAGGTADVALRIARAAGGAAAIARARGSLTVIDINPSMMAVGRDRVAAAAEPPSCGLAARHAERRAFARRAAAAEPPSLESAALGAAADLAGTIGFVCADAEALPLADASVDAYVIAFGLRNVTRPMRALEEARRVLAPGGRYLCLEFSRPRLPLLAPVYDRYCDRVLPWLGDKVAGDAESYRYLAESIRRFPDQRRLASMMAQAGFEQIRVRDLAGGIAALHSAWAI